MRLSRFGALGIGFALIATSCASVDSAIEIGFQRISLDLAFKDEELAEPIPPREVITKVIEVPVEEVQVQAPPPQEPPPPKVVETVTVIPPPPEDPCPKAPEGLAPERAAFAVVKDPPTEGLYSRHNTGTFEVETPTGATQYDIPPTSGVEISSVREFEGTIGLDQPEEDAEPDPLDPVTQSDVAKMPIVEFTMKRQTGLGNSVTDTYQYTNGRKQVVSDGTEEAGPAEEAAVGDYLHLVRRVTVARGVEQTFTPSPPIRMVRLNTGTEGDMANAGVVHSGVDPETGVAMTVESQVVTREWTDVCGEMFDTYRVEIKESLADLQGTPEDPTPKTSGNEDDSVNVWNIQFDNGLIILSETVTTTRRTTVEVAGAPVPVIVRYNYTSTLDSLTPEPLPEETES